MASIHDRDTLTLADLEGYELRLNEAGGRHWQGQLHDGRVLLDVDDPQRPPAGEYELSFREPGAQAWHNDARCPTVTLP